MVEVSEETEGELMVREFAKAFNWPNPDLTKEQQLALCETLIQEELKELKEAVEHTLKEMTDVSYVLIGYGQVRGDPDILQGYWDRAVEHIMSLDDVTVRQEAFKRVHESNMSKLGPDGKPMYREDGKVLKGPNYQPPDLSDLI
jgi:predicted DNA-binding protein